MQTDLKIKREKSQEASAKIRTDAKVKLEALKASFELDKDKSRAEIKKIRIEGRVKALARFDAAVLRVSTLKDRIITQTNILKAKGVDVLASASFVATAEVKLGDAKVKIAEASALLSVSANELTAENKAKFIALTKEIQTLLKDAHKALNDSIKSLKKAVKIKAETKVKATSEIEVE